LHQPAAASDIAPQAFVFWTVMGLGEEEKWTAVWIGYWEWEEEAVLFGGACHRFDRTNNGTMTRTNW
jgi:hypothetical protein